MDELKPPNVCVLIPAYNEEKNIGRVVSELRARGFSIVVCDDGSTDQTASISKSIGAEVLLTDKNEGKGASLRRGFRWFLDQNYKALLLVDADGQHDPKETERFLEALNRPGGYFVIGDRMREHKGMPLARVLTNRFMSFVLSFLSRQNVPDSQCGYRALRREVIEKLILKTFRFEIESEMILEASRLGFKIHSIPVTSVYEGGSSHIQPMNDTIRFFKFLLKYLFAAK